MLNLSSTKVRFILFFRYKNDKELDLSYTRSGDMVTNELFFTIQPNDNNAKYSCHSFNNVNKDNPYKQSFTLSVQCKYRIYLRYTNPLNFFWGGGREGVEATRDIKLKFCIFPYPLRNKSPSLQLCPSKIKKILFDLLYKI